MDLLSLNCSIISCNSLCPRSSSSLDSWVSRNWSSSRRIWSWASTKADCLVSISACMARNFSSYSAWIFSAFSRAAISRCNFSRSCCLAIFSSLFWAFICCTSMVSGLRRRMYNSWLPMHKVKIRLLMRSRGAKKTKLGALVSIGLMTNLRSLKLMLRISDQGNPILGVNRSSFS